MCREWGDVCSLSRDNHKLLSSSLKRKEECGINLVFRRVLRHVVVRRNVSTSVAVSLRVFPLRDLLGVKRERNN